MGIKKFSWKKIGTIFFIIAAIITIATNLKFVWNCLKILGSLIVKLILPLNNPIIRDVLLFFLILGLLIWLILISMRIKKFQVDDEEKLIKPAKFYGGETKEDESEEWGAEHIYLLELIAYSDKEVDDKILFSQLERKFPQASKLDFRTILDDLSEDNLISISGYLPDAKVYEATREGRKLAKKIADEMRGRNAKGRFKPTPLGRKTPKMLEVEKKLDCSLEEDFYEHYVNKKWGQKKLAKRWGVGRNLIFGKSLRGKRRSWTQMLNLPIRPLEDEKIIARQAKD